MEKALDKADPIIRVIGLPVCACADERPPWKKVHPSLMPQGVEHHNIAQFTRGTFISAPLFDAARR